MRPGADDGLPEQVREGRVADRRRGLERGRAPRPTPPAPRPARRCGRGRPRRAWCRASTASSSRAGHCSCARRPAGVELVDVDREDVRLAADLGEARRGGCSGRTRCPRRPSPSPCRGSAGTAARSASRPVEERGRRAADLGREVGAAPGRARPRASSRCAVAARAGRCGTRGSRRAARRPRRRGAAGPRPSATTPSRTRRSTSERRMPSATSRLVSWIRSCQSTGSSARPRRRARSSGCSPAGSTSTRSMSPSAS